MAGSKVPSDPTMTPEVRRFLDGLTRDASIIPALATQAQAEAGTDNAAYMSALRVAQAIAELVTPTGLVLLQTQVAATSATLDFVHGTGGVVLDDTYDRYRLTIDTLRPATDDVALYVRTGTGVGPTYDTTNYSYEIAFNTAGGTTLNSTAVGVALQLSRATATNSIGNAAAENISTVVEFANPESATQDCLFHVLGGGYCRPDGTLTGILGGVARRSAPAAITGLRVMFSSGDITSGRVSLYGYSKG